MHVVHCFDLHKTFRPLYMYCTTEKGPIGVTTPCVVQTVYHAYAHVLYTCEFFVENCWDQAQLLYVAIDV